MIRNSKSESAIKEKRLRFDNQTGQFIELRKQDLFLKGPIPLLWLSTAAALPGKALNVALAIRWVSDLSKAAEIYVTKAALQHFGLSEDAYRDGLKRLEQAGLVGVFRRAGQRARVRILTLPTTG
jgi:hypothetical protein